MKHITIIIALLFSGVLYCQTTDTLTYRTYHNSRLGYEIQYPANWYLKHPLNLKKNDTLNLEFLCIENQTEVIVAGGSKKTVNGTVFQIEIVNANIYKTPKFILDSGGIKTIQQWILHGDIPERVKQSRLKQVCDKNIDGRKLSVWEGFGWADSGIEFIYNGKCFKLSFTSGSKEQYEKDSHIFTKMIDSIKFIKN